MMFFSEDENTESTVLGYLVYVGGDIMSKPLMTLVFLCIWASSSLQMPVTVGNARIFFLSLLCHGFKNVLFNGFNLCPDTVVVARLRRDAEVLS